MSLENEGQMSPEIEKEIEKPVAEKAQRKPRKTTALALEETKSSFDISDEDLSEFKKWQKEKEASKTTKVSLGSASEDPIYRAWKEESRLVKGIYRCHEPAGGNVQFYFRKYKWDQTKEYIMEDGKVYEIPLAVARHLNANCNYPVHSHILGSDGKPTLDANGKVTSRMNFEGMEFAVA